MAQTKTTLIDMASSMWPDRKKRYSRGAILCWQGDPVEQIFVVLDGAVKKSSISLDGKVYSYGIFGAGRLVGAKSFLLGGPHESMAEVLECTELLIIPPDEFNHALTSNSAFSFAVMKELAREASDISGKARDLSFLDVQERLKHSLITLAKEHGIKTDGGVKINLNITQEEIGTLVGANRTTITACLNELKRQGYLWNEGRRLVIIPTEHVKVLDNLVNSVVKGDSSSSEQWATEAINKSIDPLKTLYALTAGMKRVDRSYSRGEIHLPDVVLAVTAMKQALPIVEENIDLEGKIEAIVGTVIIGTVLGDIHDIGKAIVAMLMRARGFRVIDLGVNVPPEKFIEAIKKYKPDILALTALTTVTSLEINSVVDALQKEKIRDRVKLMVGGAAVTESHAAEIGADGYRATAQGAVEMAWRLCTWDKGSF